jgi:hypothetical protein
MGDKLARTMMDEPSLLSQIGTTPAAPPGPPGAESQNPTALTIKVRAP